MLFDKPGKACTEKTLEIAKERGKELGIEEIVLASSHGDTAYKALEILNGFRLIVVSYHYGFEEPFKNIMPEEIKRDLQEKGINVVTSTHALSGVERSIAKKFSGVSPVLLIAETLRLFGQGTKVAVEISIMAADAGAISGKDIIAIGGTARGADTAIVIKPVNQSDFFDLRIREILCKPRNF
ncbi:MAG: hypothetical protein HQK79_01715 [Desulfobacterales bacterium]|nr:hypothetical protein [Desulfobacterales bacterium]MBF0398359.1 hypothetical protein [Desulfobacterales bacterium]